MGKSVTPVAPCHVSASQQISVGYVISNRGLELLDLSLFMLYHQYASFPY